MTGRATPHAGSARAAFIPPELPEETFWEHVGRTTRAGRYLTGHVAAALEHAVSVLGQPGRAADVGCDAGRWSTVLSRLGWRLTCLDVNNEALAVCGRRIPDATQVHLGGSEQLRDLPDGSQDLLLVCEVAPVSAAPWFVSEAVRVLAPGGVLVFTYENPHSLRGMAYRALRAATPWWKHDGMPRFEAGGYDGPSYRALRGQLTAAGFVPEHEVGLAWGPFGRKSDSGLIPAWARTESVLGLQQVPTAAPFVVAVMRRTAAPAAASPDR